MMKILVLSDSHLHLEYMQRCVEFYRPDAIFHLGDYFKDTFFLKEYYPDIPLYAVPGNCDRYQNSFLPPEDCVVRVDGLRFYLTHGHRQGVKQGLGRLIAEGRAAKAHAVVYGHTHVAYISVEEGMYVINPGSCGFFGSSAAIIETDGEKITDCRILRQSDLEEIV
jgi:putative phosphoesterase